MLGFLNKKTLRTKDAEASALLAEGVLVNDATREDLLLRVPSTPATVEVRALLEDPRTSVHVDATGAILDNHPLDLAALWETPGVGLMQTLSRQVALGRQIIALSPPRAEVVSAKVRRMAAPDPAATFEQAVVMTLVDTDRFEVVLEQSRQRTKEHRGGGIRKMVAADLLGVEDHALRAELAQAFERMQAAKRHVYVAVAATEPDAPTRAVAFAYACYRTTATKSVPGFFDVSVDTLPGHRGQGHARRTCAAMIAAERTKNMSPVWGADADNGASIATATALGFVRNGEEVWVGTFT